MYIQITTKCNMKCEHCCYSCTMHGRHMSIETAKRAVEFAAEFEGDECVTIGGGEPTLHPEFFEILKRCLNTFRYTWMATNGSQTAAMYRLRDIINGNDIENTVCTCETDDERDNCTCYDDADILDGSDDKLCVALSQDEFHDEIDKRIVEIWERENRQHRRRGFEIRDVTRSFNGTIKEGRAKKSGAGWAEGCVCSDLFIRPDGKIKLCGCNNSPVIGDIWNGITEKWQKVIQDSDEFRDERCYKSLKRRAKREDND